jgi:hydrogenase nickel incorporation protein HypA/HybF
MHELSVCASLLDTVARVAADHGAGAVSRVSVSVGPLSGIDAGLLARTFEMARRGTVAEAAILDIEATALTVRCEDCGRETDAVPNMLLCAHCGGGRVRLESGNELILKSVEFTVADLSAAAE